MQSYRAKGLLTEEEALNYQDGHMRDVFQNAVFDFISLQVRLSSQLLFKMVVS